MAESSARSDFLKAGMRLYPEYGYQKLSVRLLAAETGLSAGMFHHAFKNKAAFIDEILHNKYAQTFAQIRLDLPPRMPTIERLHQIVSQLAICLRDNLTWVQRVFADSADGIEVIERFLHAHFGRFSEAILALLTECRQEEQPDLSELIAYLAYLNGAVFSPIVLASYFQRMQLFPPSIAAKIPEIFENDAINKRIDWSFSVLFPTKAAK